MSDHHHDSHSSLTRPTDLSLSTLNELETFPGISSEVLGSRWQPFFRPAFKLQHWPGPEEADEQE
jgi:hypothetical protein